VALAVRQELERVLHGCSILPQHLWLLQPPSSLLQPTAWSVIAAAAIAAIDTGRRSLIALQLAAESAAPSSSSRQALITEYYMPMESPSPPVSEEVPFSRRAANRAIARFWCLLADFVSTTSIEAPTWSPPLPPSHPFLRPRTDGSLEVHQPP
jgi:hypothetical protein